MAQPLVNGISPREGCPGTKIIIRGQNLGDDAKDFIGLKICGEDCLETASWQSPNKIFAYVGYGKGQGDVIVTTKSGGIGKCSVSFFGRDEQAGPFQEVAFWVDEDAITLFGLNTTKTTSLLPETNNETTVDNSTTGLADELYNLFPGCSTDLTQRNFNPYYYLLANKSNVTIDELRQNFNYLKQSQTEQNTTSTKFEKNHIAPFLEAIDKVKSIRSLSADDRKNQFYSQIIRLIDDVSRQTYLIYGADITRKDISDRIRNALNLIQRYKFIFLLPQTIERCIKREEYDKATTDLIRARTTFDSIDSQIFQTIQREVEKQSQYLQKLFREHLKDFPSSVDDLKLYVHYSFLLDPKSDPAWDCIDYQVVALNNALRSCTSDSIETKFHLLDQACDIFKSAFSDLWHLIQLYFKRKFYPSATVENIEQIYTHKTSEFISLINETVEIFIQIVRSNLFDASIDIFQRAQIFPHHVQTCRLCVLHVSSLDLSVEIKTKLHQLIFDLRFECFQILIESTFQDISQLAQQETWQLDVDEQCNAHTKLPDLFHDYIVTKANIIYENILTVNITKGERKFFDDEQVKRQAAIGIYRLVNSFIAVFESLKVENVSNTNRLLILLSNLSYTRQFILPRLKKLFIGYDFRGMDRVYDEIENNYKTIHEEFVALIHDVYIRNYFQNIKSRMYAGNFDWANHSQVSQVSNYIKHIIFDLARVYAEIYSINHQMTSTICSRISLTIANELKAIYSKIGQFNQEGSMQACLDMLSLRECLDYCMTNDLSNLFEEILQKIPNLNEHKKSKELKKIFQQFLKQIQPY